MTFPSVRKLRYDTTPVIVAALAAMVAVGVLLVWQNSASQERYSTLRSGQATGLEQRTDQTQLTCALWALLLEEREKDVPASLYTAANKICSTVPTPLPSSAP
ncbi:hypothetical protein ACFW2V_12645 [Streptomyces sp. NPDC058947]|uniref:hypothetical protein n=1 Tax=Streptomyces sp. NPDC058947 TaxID=3346675 RepID=UPI0036AAFD5A